MLLPVEIRILVYGAILLLIHIMVEGYFKTKQYGTKWNMGARDERPAPLNETAQRLGRARGNYMETLPIAIIALFGVVLAGKADFWTGLGGWIWLGARAVYLPLYWKGVPKVRSYVWLLSMAGLAIVIWPLVWSD